MHVSLKGSIKGEEATSVTLCPKLSFGPGSIDKDSCWYFVQGWEVSE